MPPLALFDLDNTLVDRQAAFHRWAEWFSDEHDLGALAADWFCAADNDGFAQRVDLFEEARERFDMKESLEDLVASYWVDYSSFYVPDPEVTGALARLRASGWRVAVVTNGPPTQHVKVARAGLEELIDACCVSQEVGVQKPDSRIFDEAIRQCGCLIGDGHPAWMVGDTPEPDIKGGRDAGLRTVWMHRGREWSISDYEPDAKAGSVADAVEVLLAG